MNLPSDPNYSPGQASGDLQGVHLVTTRRPSATTAYVGQMQQVPMQWVVSPAQQSPVSPMDIYDSGWAARQQRMHALRSGFFDPTPVQSAGSGGPPPLLRPRQRYIQNIPPPPVFSEPLPHRRVSINSFPPPLSSVAFYHQDDPRVVMVSQPQGQSIPQGDYTRMQFMRRSSVPPFSPSQPMTAPAYFQGDARFAFPSPNSIPTRLHNLQSDRKRPKPVSPINPRLYFPSSFYPSSRDVVIEWCFDDERATSFPGKNGQFEALLAASYPAFVSCRSKGQVSTLIDAIVDTIIRNHGQFVTPERVNDNVLWRRAEPDMARAFCVHRLQLWNPSRDGPSRPSPATHQVPEDQHMTERANHRKKRSCDDTVGSDAEASEGSQVQTGLISVKFKRPRKRSSSA